MDRKSWKYKIFAVMAILALLTGCQAQSTPEPTLDPISIQVTTGVIQTQAASTVIADLTLNAPTATQTSEPTATAEPPTATIPPTATEVPPTATISPSPTIVYPTFTTAPTNTPAPSSTPTSYKCTVTEQSPEFGLDIKPGDDFDATWTVKNTSSDTWTSANVDLKYISGTKMQKIADSFDLNGDVAADGTVKLAVDMYAPKEKGRYSATWGLVSGPTTLCVFSVTIDVVE